MCCGAAVKGSDVYPEVAKRDNFSGKDINKTRLEFHSDQGATDLIVLLSLNKAKSGGTSKWVSAVAIHNELLRRGRKVSNEFCIAKPRHALK